MIYAVIDTNVFVSVYLTKRLDSPTVRILKAITDGKVTPVFNDDVIAEYREVLSREKFGIPSRNIQKLLDDIHARGIYYTPAPYEATLTDEDDRPFYEVTLAAQDKDARLVTGNTKHFPKAPFVVTPAEFMAIVDAAYPEDTPAA